MTLREYTNWVNQCIKDGLLSFEQGFKLIADKAQGTDKFPSIETAPKKSPRKQYKTRSKAPAVSVAAPWGFKKDGVTPKKRPGKQKVVAPVNGTQAQATA